PDFRAVTAAARADDESQRLAEVKRYDILDTPPEDALDRITALAADLFGASIALICIVDRDRIWFKSHHGLDITEIGHQSGALAVAIQSIEPWPLADIKDDIWPLVEASVLDTLKLRFFVGTPLLTRDGRSLGKLCVIDREPRKVNERQMNQLKALAAITMDQLEARLAVRVAGAQAQILAGETDHRVMNSLQLVSSLLNAQSRAVALPEASSQLAIAANRIAAVARVHRHFSRYQDEGETAVLAYLRRICCELANVFEADIKVDGVEAKVPTGQIRAIGLIVNELLTNAVKHGGGSITVTFTHDAPDQYVLCITDQGDGLPEDFTPAGKNSLGMKVIIALAAQLGGKLSAAPNPAGKGACFTVTFPSS
ncbi:MAG: histidine kinase dimerization/phosphoacceptor domain -containing protein, partial [Rhodospirillales bacterium]